MTILNISDTGKIRHGQGLSNPGLKVLYITRGTGKGYSVKEIISIVKKITNNSFNVEISNRREGDPPILVADNKKAYKLLDWKPKHDLLDIVKSAYKWFNNPKY